MHENESDSLGRSHSRKLAIVYSHLTVKAPRKVKKIAPFVHGHRNADTKVGLTLQIVLRYTTLRSSIEVGSPISMITIVTLI